jgi:hypothetical protein
MTLIHINVVIYIDGRLRTMRRMPPSREDENRSTINVVTLARLTNTHTGIPLGLPQFSTRSNH